MIEESLRPVKRVAFPYESRLGRNDGSPLYYSHLVKRTPGFEMIHFTSEDTGDLDKWGRFDAWIWVDWGEDALKEMLPYTPMSLKDKHPSIYICSDTHLGREYRFEKALEFDWVFFNQKRAMEEFTALFPEKKEKVFWLPHAVEPLAYPNKPVSIKKFDIGFVGYVSFRKRAEMLDRMFKEFPNFFYGQRFSRWIYGEPADGQDTADIFRKSKIVFSTAAVDDVQMRTFEALATGSFLLTEWVPTLEELFENKKHLVWYKTMDEAVELAKYYLENEIEREMIATAGMQEVLANHTYEKRFEKILSIIKI